MKHMIVASFHDSAFGSPAPAPGRHRHVNSRLEIRPRAACGRAVRIE
jgi:hypothetical protein